MERNETRGSSHLHVKASISQPDASQLHRSVHQGGGPVDVTRLLVPHQLHATPHGERRLQLASVILGPLPRSDARRAVKSRDVTA